MLIYRVVLLYTMQIRLDPIKPQVSIRNRSRTGVFNQQLLKLIKFLKFGEEFRQFRQPTSHMYQTGARKICRKKNVIPMKHSCWKCS